MRRPGLLRRFGQARQGIVAIEFAFIVPLLLAVFFGGFAIAQAVAVSRKVTITTRALADLTTQFSTMSTTDMTNVLDASAQIMAPFSSAPLAMRLTEITTDVTGLLPKVAWSKAVGLTPYIQGAAFTLPVSMLKPNTSYVFSETQYQYTPLTNFGIGTFQMSDHIYMLPRLSAAVIYTGT